MRLLFQQRFFSWFDSYNIYDEMENTVFTVEGRLAWGHKLEISNSMGEYMGTVQEEALTLLPRFLFFLGETYVGELRKEFSLFTPRFTLDMNGWEVTGNLWGWDYTVTDPQGNEIMRASKEAFHWTDTYVLDVAESEHVLLCLMIVLAIDIAKCAQSG